MKNIFLDWKLLIAFEVLIQPLQIYVQPQQKKNLYFQLLR